MDHSKKVLKLTEDFLKQLDLGQEISIKVESTDEPDSYNILLQTTQPALLIGYHGETLSAIQLLLIQHLRAQTQNWINLSVNINDYKERRESSLHSLSNSLVAKVISSGLPHSLPPMSANERRIIHLFLADHPQVTTFSQGVGHSRVLVISPKV